MNSINYKKLIRLSGMSDSAIMADWDEVINVNDSVRKDYYECNKRRILMDCIINSLSKGWYFDFFPMDNGSYLSIYHVSLCKEKYFNYTNGNPDLAIENAIIHILGFYYNDRN